MKKDAIIAALAFGGLKPVPTVDAQVVQSTGTSAAAVMSQKATTDALNQKQNAADPAGLADNLTPYSADSGATQSVPFIAQGTGCGNGESIVDTGSYAQVKKKLGNTVCVNQLAKELNSTNWTAANATSSYSGGVATVLATAQYGSIKSNTFRIEGGRKYLIHVAVKPSSTMNVRLNFNQPGHARPVEVTRDIWNHITFVYSDASSYATNAMYIQDSRASDWDSFDVRDVYIIDLSLWYGSTSNIPAHLLSHPEDFGRYYSGSLAYNPGQLVNADGSVLTSIGRNCFGGTVHIGKRWQNGSYVNTGNTMAATDDLTAVSPNTEYAFALPQKAATTALYIQEFDASKTWIRGVSALSIGSAGYVTYTVGANTHFVALSFYHSADFVASEVSEVDISRYYSGESGYGQHYPFSVLAQIDTGSEALRSAGSVADEKAPDGTITRKVGVRAYEAGDESDVTVITDMTNTYYPLATPTTEHGTPFSGASADNFAIDDFGSMYWTQSAGVPQGAEIFYPYDYKAAVDTILNEVNGDVTKLVTAEKVPDAPSSNGTYVLKVTVSDGTPTYSWVADE